MGRDRDNCVKANGWLYKEDTRKSAEMSSKTPMLLLISSSLIGWVIRKGTRNRENHVWYPYYI